MDIDLFDVHREIIIIDNFNDPIPIYPFGDVHYNNPSFHDGKFNEFIYDAKQDPKARFIGMGDYIETFSDSERNGLLAAKLHESSSHTIENMVQRSVDEFIEKISFMKGRIIGLLEGNHYFMFGTGISSTQYMCEKLGCRYLGASAFVRLTLQYGKGHRRSCVDIFAHHGKGASRLVGGSLNTVAQMAECAHADIYIMGHDHRKSVGMGSRLELCYGFKCVNLREKRLLFIRSGSFLRGYEPGRGNYVSKKLLNPADLGYVKIMLYPKYKAVHQNGVRVTERFYIDTHASI